MTRNELLLTALLPYVANYSGRRRYSFRDRDTSEFRSWSDEQKEKRAAKKRERNARKKSR